MLPVTPRRITKPLVSEQGASDVSPFLIHTRKPLGPSQTHSQFLCLSLSLSLPFLPCPLNNIRRSVPLRAFRPSLVRSLCPVFPPCANPEITKTSLRSPRKCHRHVRGVSGKPILVYKEGRCAAIPLVGISKNFRRNVASVTQLSRSNNTVFIFDAKQASAYQGPTQLPLSATRVGSATPQGLYTLDMNTYRSLLRSSTSTAHLAGEATSPNGISQVSFQIILIS